jgi:hypothetical protein
VLQFAHLGGAVGNTFSHGSESSSRCSAQQEKQSVNIEELGDSSEEEEPQRRQRINWSEEENDRQLYFFFPFIGLSLQQN